MLCTPPPLIPCCFWHLDQALVCCLHEAGTCSWVNCKPSAMVATSDSNLRATRVGMAERGPENQCFGAVVGGGGGKGQARKTCAAVAVCMKGPQERQAASTCRQAECMHAEIC